MKNLIYKYLKSILVILIINFNLEAQDVQILAEYDYYYIYESNQEMPKSTLQNYNSKSLFTIYKKEFDPNTIDFDEDDKMIGVLVDFNDEVFKDFESEEMYYYSNFSFNKKAILKDTMNKLNWTINSKNTKEILGYKCIEARTSFHGRNYIAYFSPEIPTNDGPWKFYGLPGLILEVYEENKMIHFVAKSLNIRKEPVILEPSFELKYAISWEKGLEMAKENFKKYKIKRLACCGENPIVDTSNSLEMYSIME